MFCLRNYYPMHMQGHCPRAVLKYGNFHAIRLTVTMARYFQNRDAAFSLKDPIRDHVGRRAHVRGLEHKFGSRILLYLQFAIGLTQSIKRPINCAIHHVARVNNNIYTTGPDRPASNCCNFSPTTVE